MTEWEVRLRWANYSILDLWQVKVLQRTLLYSHFLSPLSCLLYLLYASRSQPSPAEAPSPVEAKRAPSFVRLPTALD